MNHTFPPLSTVANSAQTHWIASVVLCFLLCWTAFHGVQSSSLYNTTAPQTVECFGACGLDAVMDAEVSVEAANHTQTCGHDERGPCETDDSDGDVLHSWKRVLSAVTPMSRITPLVPAREFEHTPLRKPPRNQA